LSNGEWVKRGALYVDDYLDGVPTPITYEEPTAAPPTKQAASLQRISPSFSDVFFLIFTAWMFLISPVGWQALLLDADTALHTRIGQYILSTGSVPTHDLFAFSKPGQTWYAFEWLSETAFAGLFNLAGFKGIALLAGMLIALAITLLLKYAAWRGANAMIALAVVLLAATAASVHFHARPHLFTLVFLAASVWMMEYNRRNVGRLIWALVPLTILWANLHGGFFILFALLGLRVLGCAAEAWCWPQIRQARWKEAVQLAGVGVACAVASLANPYGFHLHTHILETLSSPWIMTNVSEFKSPVFRREEMYDFMVLLFAGLASIASLVRKRNLTEPLWLLFLGYCALSSVRHTTLYVFIAAPIIAVELSEWWAKVAARFPKASLLGTLDDVSRQLTARMPGTGLFIPLVIATLMVAPGIHWPTAFPEGGVPMKLIEPHLDLLASGRLFTSDQIADYLVFRSYPRQKVFMDSRHNYYGEKIGNDYLAINNGGRKWRGLLDDYAFTVILCDADAPLASLVQAAGGWRVVDTDGKFILFEREKRS
jgi:hypothetical protein